MVNWIEQRARKLKIGHAGTLDPLATGVLIVCVGYATRLVPYLHQLPKTYVATFLLGRRSESDDIDTEVELNERRADSFADFLRDQFIQKAS